MMGNRIRISSGAILAAALIFFYCDTQLLLALLVPAAVHELGHIVALRLCGFRVRSFRAEMKGLCIDYGGSGGGKAHILSALAGPGAGLMYAVAASFAGRLLESNFFLLSAGISFLLSVFNLLPALPLDGGRVFFQLCCRLFGGKKGDRICRGTAFAVAALMLAAGAWLMWEGYGIGLLTAAIWLLLSQPEGIVKRKEML